MSEFENFNDPTIYKSREEESLSEDTIYISFLKLLETFHVLFKKNIMTKKGADLWMYYMIESLKEIKNDIDFDDRIFVCIVDFLHYFMMKYGYEFDFNFTSLKNSNL